MRRATVVLWFVGALVWATVACGVALLPWSVTGIMVERQRGYEAALSASRDSCEVLRAQLADADACAQAYLAAWRACQRDSLRGGAR